MKIKYIVLVSLSSLAVACTSTVNYPQAPLDTKAVQEYNTKVFSGNTVPTNQKSSFPKQVDMPLNQSDNVEKSPSKVRLEPVIQVGYGYPSRPWYW